MLATAGSLIVGAAVFGLVPGAGRWARGAADQFLDFRAYGAVVLDGLPTGTMKISVEAVHPDSRSLAFALGAALAAVAFAAWALFRDHLPPAFHPGKGNMSERIVSALQSLHSGHVGDYAAWLTAGTVVLGSLFAFALRR